MSVTSVALLRTPQSWIQKTPDVCGGAACIRDTRIPVWSLVVAHRLGASDEQLQNYFVAPLTAGDVQTAWTYVAQNSGEIEAAIRQNDES